jgi:SAM-dependent methyltransferase
MKEELLDVLAEPGTGAPLELQVQESREGAVWEGSLRSAETGKVYPIRRGIPRFVPETNYADSFGLQWNLFSRVQMDSATGADYSRKRFEGETQWTGEQLRGQWVLDGGCGCGRFSEIAAQKGARVIAMDFSAAVDAAAENLRSFPNVHCVQGDLLQPPIRPGSLAHAFSIGVLQHTPDPGGAFRSILRLLAPGGCFALTMYARRWYTKLNAKYLVRPVTRRLPQRVLLGLIRGTMPVLFPVTDVLFRLPVAGKFAQFVIPVANYVGKTGFTREQRYREAVLDTFDMLSPTYDQPMTAAEIEAILRECGIDSYRFRRRVPIEVTGTAPSARAQVGTMNPGLAGTRGHS